MRSKYILPSKRKGEAKEPVTMKLDPDFRKALQMYADRESEIEMIKIAPATVLTTLALQGSSELRRLYKDLKKQRNAGIRRKAQEKGYEQETTK